MLLFSSNQMLDFIFTKIREVTFGSKTSII